MTVMTDEDRERNEASLDLERFMEKFQADGAIHLPGDVTPEQWRIYRVVTQFCAASPDALEPDPAFVEALRTRLLALAKQRMMTP
jgi:hypothetical protein